VPNQKTEIATKILLHCRLLNVALRVHETDCVRHELTNYLGGACTAKLCIALCALASNSGLFSAYLVRQHKEQTKAGLFH
jgi:hypothetical protein